MYRLFAILLTVVQAWHAVAGCCMHHTHACETNCCPESTANAEACPCDNHSHDNLTADSMPGRHHADEGGDRHKRHRCTQDDCLFVSSPPITEEFNGIENNSDPLEIGVADARLDMFHSDIDRALNQRRSVACTSLQINLVLRV